MSMSPQAHAEYLFSAEAKRIIHLMKEKELGNHPVKSWQSLDKFLRSQGYHAPSYLGSVNSSAKIIKGKVHNVNTFVMYMAPAKFAGYGNVCPQATVGCEASCLNMSGRANFDKSIVQARVLRTWIFYGARELFTSRLIYEIASAARLSKKKGLDFAVRINGTSDLSPNLFDNLLDKFPDVQFYDYTKVTKRAELAHCHDNYHLTYSWHDGADWDNVKSLGMPIAVPFYQWDDKKQRIKHPKSVTLPTTYMGLPVFDGDTTDLRYLDRKLGAPDGAYIVGLRAKRTNRRDEQVAIDTGFFQPI